MIEPSFPFLNRLMTTTSNVYHDLMITCAHLFLPYSLSHSLSQPILYLCLIVFLAKQLKTFGVSTLSSKLPCLHLET